jgi:hypothetical protein
MSNEKPISPNAALRRFLDAVADEADMNAAFRNRLLLALGVPVIFEGQDDLASVHPVELAVRYDEHTFKRIYGQLKGPALKKILVDHKLASAAEAGAKGIKPPAQVELLWERACLKADEDGRA